MPLRVGEIVHIKDPFGNGGGQDKFVVVISVGPDLFFAVNTLNRSWYDCIPLEKKGRAFPRHDSFIGCKNVLTAEPSQITGHVGSLDDDEMRALSEKITLSLFLAPILQRSLEANIKAELELRAAALVAPKV